MIHHIAPLILKIMMSLVPISQHSFYENASTTQARYESIADDIAIVSENNSIFDNDDKGIKMAFLLAIIASEESGGYDAAVDSCTRGGDNNTSWSIFQITNSYAPKYKVCHDRKEAVKAAIKAIKQSFDGCHNLPFNSRLSGYDTGRCLSGEVISNRRMRKLEKLMNDFAADIAAL